ncbi:MAG: class I SAM-dependent methyltransferase [Oscillospiraceae bacterium]|nr:class I SAM-dependent methyltransferase [Oscillospiraceae bacterium]
MKQGTTGWERENRVHFDEIVANYDQIRWDYPDKLFQDALNYSGDVGKAIEIGAGTGKATLPFLQAGYQLTVVEMSRNMVNFLQDKYHGYSNFGIVHSTFEESKLNDASYSVVYAASAFHWVDASIGCPKVMELLKPGGAFVLFRNNAIPGEGELSVAVQAEYDKHYYSYYVIDNRPTSIYMMTEEDYLKPEELYRGFRLNSLEEYGFIDVTMKLYTESKRYTASKYIMLLDTYSDHRALPDSNREALYSGITKAINAHGGYMNLGCIFQLYMGRKP